MKTLLYVDACINPEKSRTKKISDALVAFLMETGEYELQTVNLEQVAPLPLSAKDLAKRNELTAAGVFDDPMFDLAHQWASADRIVVAAPYWDYGFPAVVKCYIESITAVGIVSRYTEHGPVGMCKADQILYVTTRGGFATDDQDMGYQTFKGLSAMYGIERVDCVSATRLDVPPVDVDAAIAAAIEAGKKVLR